MTDVHVGFLNTISELNISLNTLFYAYDYFRCLIEKSIVSLFKMSMEFSVTCICLQNLFRHD